MPIRVLVAEDNVLLRDGITRLINASDDLELAGECGSYDELLALAEEAKPDVVLTDIRMPPTGTDEGVRAAAALRLSHPTSASSCSASSPRRRTRWPCSRAAPRAGPTSSRTASPTSTTCSTPSATVAAGGSVIDPKVVEELVAARSKGKSPLDHLTPREGEIMAEMATGKSNAAIAAALVLSERAVEKHINSIFSKLHLAEEPDVNRRVKAVLLYLAAGGG